VPKQIRYLSVLCLLAFAIAVAFSAAQTRAETIYNIVDYPLDQGAHTISGTITTDGKTGALLASDVIGATISMDGAPFYSVNAVSGEVLQSLPVFDGANSMWLTATSDGIYLPYGSSLTLNFWTGGPWSDSARIEWNNTADNNYGAPVCEASWNYFADYTHRHYYWYAQPQGQPGELGYGLSGTWLIATAVPEPASASALLGGLLVAGAFALLRRRAAKR
jgi:hypothetical protein